MVERLLNDRDLVPDDEPAAPLETLHRNRPRRVRTLFGEIELRRTYHHHRKAHCGRAPLDETLDLVRGHTPALARLVCRASSQCASYRQAAAELEAYTGLRLEGRGFGRLVAEVAPVLDEALAQLAPSASSKDPPEVLYVCNDGTGVPARAEELAGRKGKSPDGTARTREAKLGCVFTQSVVGAEGEALRDPDSTSYVGTLEGCRRIGTLLREEAFRRGYGGARQTVYIGDGAAWIWENARINFPDAVQILDFYHAAEHLGDLASALFGNDAAQDELSRRQWHHRMKHEGAAPVIASAKRLFKRRRADLDEPRIKILEREIAYFQTNAARTCYGRFREQGYFIGSGVVEAGCKNVIGRRMKQSGMFWSQEGAENLLSLRCLLMGPHFDAAWNARRAILSRHRAEERRWLPSDN